MIKAGILGATGYTALELMKILSRHAGVDVIAATTRQEGCRPVSEVHPQLNGLLEVTLEQRDPTDVAAMCDVVFSCLPHAASAASVLQMVDATRVVDFSADFRLWDSATYSEWYQADHPAPHRLGAVPYGLPELYREQIRSSQLVANPGCYPTSAILAMAPLLKAGLIDPGDLLFDSKSGVSGAGRTPRMTTLYPECNESVSAYGVGQHRHAPEIAQILSDMAGESTEIIFTPHLIPMDRGILTTGYARRTKDIDLDSVLQVFGDFYADEPFVRIVERLPSTKNTAHTNFCDITARIVGN